MKGWARMPNYWRNGNNDPDRNNPNGGNGKGPNPALTVLLIAVGLIAIFFFLPKPNNNAANVPTEATQTDYATAFNDNRVTQISVQYTSDGGAKFTWTENNKTIAGKTDYKYIPYISREDAHDFVKAAREKRIKIIAAAPKTGSIWLSWLPFIFLLGIWWYFSSRMQKGAGNIINSQMNFGKSRARLHAGDGARVTFEDVAGADEAKEELQEVIEFLRWPKKFQELGAKIPRGVLLIGPPGCGKTLLAKAVAGEAGVHFFSISGSEFVEMFVGVGASRVRDLFEQAKKSAPCLIFIDEIDAVGRHRGAGLGGGHDEREQTLNQLLVELDGFEPNSGIIIIAATNRPDILDPALLRPGRFDRRVTVDNPDAKGREAILAIHFRGKQIDESVKLPLVAKGTPGFSGADLANVANESALLAARRGKKKIGRDEVSEAIERVIAGPQRKNRILKEKDLKFIAAHESGHAIAAKFTPNADPPRKVTLNPRGLAAGYMISEIEETYITTKTDLIAEIKVLLAGRASVALIFGVDLEHEEDVYLTGDVNDLQRVKKIVHQIVSEFGMARKEDGLRNIYLSDDKKEIFMGKDMIAHGDFSDLTMAKVDEVAEKIISRCYDKVKELLIEHRSELDNLRAALLDRRTLEAEEIDLAIEGKLPPLKPEEKPIS